MVQFTVPTIPISQDEKKHFDALFGKHICIIWKMSL